MTGRVAATTRRDRAVPGIRRRDRYRAGRAAPIRGGGVCSSGADRGRSAGSEPGDARPGGSRGGGEALAVPVRRPDACRRDRPRPRSGPTRLPALLSRTGCASRGVEATDRRFVRKAEPGDALPRIPVPSGRTSARGWLPGTSRRKGPAQAPAETAVLAGRAGAARRLRRRHPVAARPGCQLSPGLAMRYPTPRRLNIQVGLWASSPSFARSFLTKLRTRSTLPASRPLQTLRSRSS